MIWLGKSLPTNALGGVTTHSRTNDATTGGLDLVTVNPDGGSITNFYYLDGTIKETIGTATQGWLLLVARPPMPTAINVCLRLKPTSNTDGSSSSQWTTTYADMVGRNTEILYAAVSGSPASLSYYNSLGPALETDGSRWRRHSVPIQPQGRMRAHRH